MKLSTSKKINAQLQGNQARLVEVRRSGHPPFQYRYWIRCKDTTFF